MGKSKIAAEDVALKNLRGFSLGSARFKSTGNISTGHFSLDFIIHYGRTPASVDFSQLPDYNPKKSLGIPLGKLVEIFGEEGGGKSSLAYRVVGHAQKLGYTTAWIDAEHSFSEGLAEINGCDVENIIYPETSLYAEQILDLILDLCKAEKVPMVKNGKEIMVDSPKVIVLDSVASLIPQAREEASSEQQFMALLPRLLSDNLGKIASAAETSGTLVIFVNQMREKVGIMFGNPETSPGGRALKHFSSLRIKVTKKKTKDADIIMTDDNGQEVLMGRYASIRLEKNRFAKPFLEALEIPIYYESYFPAIEEIAFDVGRQMRLINVRKGVYSWADIKIEGRKLFLNHIKDNDLLDTLIRDIQNQAKEAGNILPPELIQYTNKKEDNKEIKSSGEENDEVCGKIRRGKKKKNSQDS